MIAAPFALVGVIAAAMAAAGPAADPMHHLYLVPAVWAARAGGAVPAGLVGLLSALLQGLRVLPQIERSGLAPGAVDAVVSMLTPLAFGVILGRLADHSRGQASRLDALLGLQRALATESPLDERLSRAAALVRCGVGADRVGLVVDAGECGRAVGGAPETSGFDLRSAAGWALATGKAVAVEDLSGDPRLGALRSEAPTPTRGLVVPLEGGAGRIGVLAIERAGDLEAGAEAALRGLALHVALAVDNARLTLRQRQFAGELERKVAEATERLREIDRAKSEFLSAASHELRTPLTALQGFSELLLTRAVPPDQARRYLGHVHAEAERLGRLVADLLDLSRIESGRGLDLRRETLDLPELVARNVELFAVQHPRHRFERVFARALPAVTADRDAVDRMLKNLLSNAVKYSPRGGRVRVGAGPAAERPGLIALTVEDDGVGIAAEALPRIFDRYVRVPHPETRAAAGLGLGLCLVRSLAEAHGGSVEVESLPGKGSLFRVLLPVSPPAPDGDI